MQNYKLGVIKYYMFSNQQMILEVSFFYEIKYEAIHEWSTMHIYAYT